MPPVLLHWRLRWIRWKTIWGPGDNRLLDGSKRSAPPGPGAIMDDVGRVGDSRSVVCVELTHVVSHWDVVVRVTDRWHWAVGRTFDTMIDSLGKYSPLRWSLLRFHFQAINSARHHNVLRQDAQLSQRDRAAGHRSRIRILRIFLFLKFHEFY